MLLQCCMDIGLQYAYSNADSKGVCICICIASKLCATTGGARNLKLRGNNGGWGKGQGTGDNNFLVWAKSRLYSAAVCIKNVAGFWGRALSRGVKDANPPKS